jgi:cytoskeletal protein CcmA (bactofilin family)
VIAEGDVTLSDDAEIDGDATGASVEVSDDAEVDGDIEETD